jgi:hypothetical protein
MTMDERDLRRELEALGRLISPDPRHLAREVIRRRRRRVPGLRPFLPKTQQLRRLSPVFAVVAAGMLLGGPLLLNLASGGQRAREAVAHQILAPIREPDTGSRDVASGPIVQVPGLLQTIGRPLGPSQPGAGLGLPGPSGHPTSSPSGGGTPTPGGGSGGGGGGGGGGTGGSPPPVTWCGINDIAVTVTPSGSTYAPNQNVGFTIRAVNQSQYTCNVLTDPCDVTYQVSQPNGTVVYDSYQAQSKPCVTQGSQNPQATQQTLIPRTSVTIGFIWNRHQCASQLQQSACADQGAVSRGQYTIEGRWYSASDFSVTTGRASITLE